MRSQALVGTRSRAVADVVHESGGLQAQDARAGRLSVRPRGPGSTDGMVERARTDERSIVRTWCWRGTLHLVASSDLHWILPLVGPVFVAGAARRRAQLGLTDDRYERALKLLRRALDGGPLTRDEIRLRLAAADLAVEGQAAPHLLARAALEGVITIGPDRRGQPTYVLLADWLGPLQPAAREVCLSQLATSYLRAFGPATPRDLAAWSGLPMRIVREAWQTLGGENILEVEGGWLPSDRRDWIDAQVLAARPRLLPAFDTYLLGYADRRPALPPSIARRIHPDGGVIRPAIVLDGRVVGTWRINRGWPEVELFEEDAASALRPGLQAELADLERFLA